MNERARQILQSVFGYAEFRGQQEEIIDNLINGGDALVIMPTGGGKSLCYQIPALAREGVGIVVSPLIALMQDQVGALTQLGVRAAGLHSGLDRDAAWRIEQQLLENELDLLYVAPERLLTPRFQELLGQSRLALFAIDETHCVSQWGHDFRPEYRQLSILAERFPGVPRIALTATADEPTRNEIVSHLGLDRARLFITGFDRPNIRYQISEKRNAREQLLRFIREQHPHDAGIVYCLSRKRVEEVAEWLQRQGLKALPYHAGLPAEQRSANQTRFLREEGLIMVATVAFGMGVDKPDVRFVAHLDLPRSVEAYYQETGRAGRDGLPADAWMVYGLNDVLLLRQMMEGSEASEERKRVERQKLEAMLGLCEVTGCRRQTLLGYFGETDAPACGNCDNCLQPPQTWDGTEAARKALSCVWRTGQRFGVNHVVDVLLGNSNERIEQLQHHQLSTFGIGAELNRAQWRSVFRQLVARGLLTVDMEGYGALRLTEACRPLLRGEQGLQLRRDRTRGTERGRKPQIRVKDEKLWNALRQTRKRLADEQGVPPYTIFHDATLMEMMAAMPLDADALLRVSGVGERKLDRYGDEFLAVLREHAGLGESAGDDTLDLFRLGMDVGQIAARQDVNEAAVYRRLARHIEAGELPLTEVVTLEATMFAAARDALLQADRRGVRGAYEQLDGAVSHGVLHCLYADMKREGA